MRQILAGFVLLLSNPWLPREGVLWAQQEEFSLTAPYLLCPVFSAPVVNDTLWANVDLPPDTLFDDHGNVVGFDSITSAYLFYSTNNQNTWDSLPLTVIGDTFYEVTWERTFLYPGAGNSYCYFRAVDDSGSNFGTESPKNTANIFPAPTNLLARACIESPNDGNPNAPGDFLELTDFRIGFSDNKIYGVLSNATGTWPWNEGGMIPLEWYAYGFAIINPPEFKADSDTVYLAVRADMPLLITEPGLYKIYEDEGGNTQIVRIANIEHQVSGGRLHIRFNLADLINDPNFGPYRGELAVAAATSWATLGGMSFADGTEPTRFYPRIHLLTPGTNTSPYLVNPLVEPVVGDSTTTFTFSVTYVDNQNNLPPVKNLYIDANPWVLGTPDHSYHDSSFFSKSLGPFTPGWHRFYFEFNDGEYSVVSALDSFHVQEEFIAEVSSQDISPYFLPTVIRPGFAVTIPKDMQIQLYNVLGEEVFVKDQPGTFIVPDFGAGIYFVRLTQGKIERIRKVILLK